MRTAELLLHEATEKCSRSLNTDNSVTIWDLSIIISAPYPRTVKPQGKKLFLENELIFWKTSAFLLKA